MLKFVVWLIIFASIHPYLAMLHVGASIVQVLIGIIQDEAQYRKPRNLT